MKKLLLSCLGICLFSSISFAAMDYTCYNECMNEGYSMGYCKELCSYENPNPLRSPKNRQMDYKCFNECIDQGYSYGYCQDRCSYGE